MVRRQRIVTTKELEGRLCRLTVTRDFVLDALVRRDISDAEFFEFVERNSSALALLAVRKIRKEHLSSTDILLDQSEFAH